MHKDACSRFCCGAKTGMRVWQRMWSPNGFAQMQLCASWQPFGCLFRVSICSWSFKERAARWSVTREKSELLWDNTDEMSRLMQRHCTGVSTHCVYLSAGTCEETLLLLFFFLWEKNIHIGKSTTTRVTNGNSVNGRREWTRLSWTAGLLFCLTLILPTGVPAVHILLLMYHRWFILLFQFCQSICSHHFLFFPLFF